MCGIASFAVRGGVVCGAIGVCSVWFATVSVCFCVCVVNIYVLYINCIAYFCGAVLHIRCHILILFFINRNMIGVYARLGLFLCDVLRCGCVLGGCSAGVVFPAWRACVVCSGVACVGGDGVVCGGVYTGARSSLTFV